MTNLTVPARSRSRIAAFPASPRRVASPRGVVRRESGSLVMTLIPRDNGPTFSGRAGTGHCSDHEDHDARPVRCNGWLSTARAAGGQPLQRDDPTTHDLFPTPQ